MKKIIILILLLTSCTDKMKDQAQKLSKEIIIADGHIDLPYRLHKEGLINEKNINTTSINCSIISNHLFLIFFL